MERLARERRRAAPLHRRRRAPAAHAACRHQVADGARAGRARSGRGARGAARSSPSGTEHATELANRLLYARARGHAADGAAGRRRPDRRRARHDRRTSAAGARAPPRPRLRRPAAGHALHRSRRCVAAARNAVESRRQRAALHAATAARSPSRSTATAAPAPTRWPSSDTGPRHSGRRARARVRAVLPVRRRRWRRAPVSASRSSGRSRRARRDRHRWRRVRGHAGPCASPSSSPRQRRRLPRQVAVSLPRLAFAVTSGSAALGLLMRRRVRGATTSGGNCDGNRRPARTVTQARISRAKRRGSSSRRRSAPSSSGTTSTCTRCWHRSSRRCSSPRATTTAALLSAFATYAAGFLVRPFGALVFGRIGDLVGRKYTFLVTILVMGFSTFAVGLLPTYASIGWAAPILLVSAAAAAGPGARRRVRRRGNLRRGARGRRQARLRHGVDPDDGDARPVPRAARHRRCAASPAG